MNEHIPERDWKLWRALSPQALDRFCRRILNDAAAFAEGSGTAHERYHELVGFLQDRNHEMARVFDDQRRSNAKQQIAFAVAAGVVTRSELDMFSEETRTVVELLIAAG